MFFSSLNLRLHSNFPLPIEWGRNKLYSIDECVNKFVNKMIERYSQSFQDQQRENFRSMKT